MSKLVYDIRVIRFEGTKCFNSFEVFLNQIPLETSCSESAEKSFTVNTNGIYKISLKSECLSISFRISLFEDDGMIWLPLSNDPEDFISAQPEEVPEPRVLLLVHKKQIEEALSSIITEESDTEKEYMPEIKLNYFDNTMIIYEDNYEASYCHDQSPDFYEPNTTENKKDTNKSSFSNPQIHDFNADSQENLNIQKEFNQNILEEIAQKDSDIACALHNIEVLKTELHKLEAENSHLKSLVPLHPGVKIADLVSEINLYKKKIEDLENSNYGLNAAKPGNFNTENLYEAIKNQCKILNIPVLVKDNEGVYVYSNKKINMSLKKGKVMCRIGNISKEFKQYLDENSSENKSIAYNYVSKSPFRKNLGEFNSCSDTPKQASKPENFIISKPRSAKKLSQSLQRKPGKKC
jgi:hypothetical protein